MWCAPSSPCFEPDDRSSGTTKTMKRHRPSYKHTHTYTLTQTKEKKPNQEPVSAPPPPKKKEEILLSVVAQSCPLALLPSMMLGSYSRSYALLSVDVSIGLEEGTPPSPSANEFLPVFLPQNQVIQAPSNQFRQPFLFVVFFNVCLCSWFLRSFYIWFLGFYHIFSWFVGKFYGFLLRSYFSAIRPS